VLDYSSAFRASLSAGYDRDIIVWNPYVRSIFYRLIGHDKPVMNLFAAQNSPEIISADTAGRVKIWDIRTLQCLQTLEARDFSFSTMCINPSRHEIFTAGKDWHVWKSVTSGDNDVTSKSGIKDVVFNPHHNTWVVVAGREVSLWSAVEAHMLAHFEECTDSDITAITINHTGRQIILGTASGLISV